MLVNKHLIGRAATSINKRMDARSGLRRAAVLMLFFDRNAQTHVVFIRRTTGDTTHSGDIAFPGGKIDKLDASGYAAAVRETQEEIGVVESSFEALGSLGYFETLTTKFDAQVHLARCPEPPTYTRNQFEVAEIIEIPITILMSQFNPALDLGNPDSVFQLHFVFTPANSTAANIWGLTARITHTFLAGLRRHL